MNLEQVKKDVIAALAKKRGVSVRVIDGFKFNRKDLAGVCNGFIDGYVSFDSAVLCADAVVANSMSSNLKIKMGWF